MTNTEAPTTIPQIVFEEPPEQASVGREPGLSPLGLWLSALRQTPPPADGPAFARFPEPVAPNVSSRIKNGKAYGSHPGEFECRTVKADDKDHRILYVRFIPEAERPAVSEPSAAEQGEPQPCAECGHVHAGSDHPAGTGAPPEQEQRQAA